MSKKLYIVILVAGLCAVLLGALLWFNNSKSPESVESFTGAEAGELRELKQKWVSIIKEKGGEAAYAAFLKEAPTLGLEVHGQAHAFGEALYEAEGIKGLVACDASFEFGCYHSFFGVAVNEEGIGTLPQFDQACRDKYKNMNLPCQHGIGHGVVVYTDYALEDALKLCETISDLPTGGCSSGVFMEYNFHTMSLNGNYLRSFEGDAYEPCSTLPEKYQASCYMEQVQWWENVFQFDYEKLGQLCAEIPSEDQAILDACYHGIGNYAAEYNKRKAEGTQETCALMPDERSTALCHEGASWLIRGAGEGMDEAAKMCEALAGEHKASCFNKLGLPTE